MAVRPIVTVPDPVLRKKARKVSTYGPDLQRLIDDMIDTMRQAPGVGLAAPQVGVSQRVIVVEYGEEDPQQAGTGIPKRKVASKLYVVVNPELVRPSQTTETGAEGCLSVPGYAGEVERLTQVTIRGFSRRGTPTRLRARGWLARIFQHELDHLNGVLFTDRASRVWRVEPETEAERV
ncbi:MAG: peptide deformylase [Anaerolineales bacterium]|jgi:peptide deformylase